MADMISFGMLFIMPIFVDYIVYRLWTYDWAQWAKDCENMGDDGWP